MPKIALIELYHHAEVLRSFYYFLLDYQPSIFASPGFEVNDLYFNIGNNCPFYLRPQNQTIPDFLLNNHDLLDGFDWLLFITIENNYAFFARQAWKPKTVMLIHDGNYWLDYHRNLSLSRISKFGKWLRDFLSKQAKNRCRIVERMDFLMFPDPLIRESIINRGLLKSEKCMPSIPLFLGEPNIADIQMKEITIVIPGSIKEEIRDYWQVVDAFTSTLHEFKKPVTLVLLGKPVGRRGLEVQEKFRHLNGGNFSMVCFSEKVHQQEYDRRLQMADFIILPLRKNIRISECGEVGGLTKISGAINDALRFQKFSLISDGYALDTSYDKVTMKYSDAFDLGRKIVKLLESLPIPANFSGIMSRWEKEGEMVKATLEKQFPE